METFYLLFAVPFVAVLLDSLFGDPHWLPHPVRLIGKGLDLFEKVARRFGVELGFAGWVAVPLFSLGSWLIVELLLAIPYLSLVLALYFAYAGLALGCLVRETRKVLYLLDADDLIGARRALGMLVSRDTSNLDANAIRRSLAETFSENLNDGFVAPLFYLAIFGPGGMWAYKAISTMDSMWGYRTGRYVDLGRGAAKTDDVLAWIPARLTAQAMLLVGKWQGLDHEAAKENYYYDALKMESPNAGYPMAVAAWLMKGQMGGLTSYFGQLKEKPILGPAGSWDREKILKLVAFGKTACQYAAWAMIIIFGLIRCIF